MDKKIIAIMVSLLVVAALVVAFILVAAGGFGSAGGFTKLFDKLELSYVDNNWQYLELPESWDVGDEKRVSDMIVDMSSREESYGTTTVYFTTLWFVYLGDKWNNPSVGTFFNVPDTSHDEYLRVSHGLFSIEVSTPTNLSAQYDMGDVISLKTTLEINENSELAFADWIVTNV